MTRINCVDPRLLSDKHLVAEYRELPRIFTLVRRAQERGLRPSHYQQPVTEYTLGPGHCRFFYTRLGYLITRYADLVREMRARGFTVNFPELPAFGELNPGWYDSWSPDQRAVDLNVKRINERGGLRPAT